MPVTCEIKFENNPMKVVSAGGNISGKVRLVLTDRKIVSGVYIQIYGSAFVRWIERLDSGEHPKEYTGNEEYLNEKTYFLRSGAGGTGIVLLRVKTTVSLIYLANDKKVGHIFYFQALFG